MGYVYRYLHEDRVVYVGQTKNELSKRIRQHCKEVAFLGLTDVEYIEIPNNKDFCTNNAYLTSTEEFYIQKYNPILNVKRRPELIRNEYVIKKYETEWQKFNFILACMSIEIPLFCKEINPQEFRIEMNKKIFQKHLTNK